MGSRTVHDKTGCTTLDVTVARKVSLFKRHERGAATDGLRGAGGRRALRERLQMWEQDAPAVGDGLQRRVRVLEARIVSAGEDRADALERLAKAQARVPVPPSDLLAGLECLRPCPRL